MANTPYATVDELKAQSETVATKYDAVMQLFLNAAAEVIDGFCNRGGSFVATNPATVRQYSGSGIGIQRIDDCTAVTLVEIKYSPSDAAWTALTSADWVLFSGDERRPNFNRTPFSHLMLTATGLGAFPSGQYTSWPWFTPDGTADRARGLPTVRVTAKFGYADAVPSQVKAATIAQAHRWLKRGQASWSDALANGDTGMLLFKKVLDPDIQHMLVNARLVRPAL